MANRYAIPLTIGNINGDLIPSGDDTYDIGSATAAWQDLFLEGDVHLSDATTIAITAAAHDTAGPALIISAGDTTAGTTDNIAGGALTIQGGQGKGSGAGGDIIFQTANAGSSGSTINALATALTISDDGSATFANLLYLNETSNANMTTGITINQGADDDEVLAFKSSDVGHGMTTRAENDTFGEMKKVSAGNGGLQVNGYSESTTALRIHGMGKTDNTTKTQSAAAYVAINASKASGTGITSVGANGNLLVVQMQGLTRFLVDEDGDLFADGGTTTDAVTVYDSYDDALLVRAVDHSRSSKNIIRSKWDDFVQYSEQSLIDAGILGDTIENGGLFNITGLQRLHNGAIWQAYVERRQFEERMNTLESKLLMLEGGK